MVERLTPGAIHRPREIVRLHPAGKAVNVARRPGPDASARVLRCFRLAAGMPLRRARGRGSAPAPAAGSLRRCTSIYDAAAGNLTELYEPGGDPGGDAWDRFAALVVSGARAAATREPIVIAGSLPPAVGPEAFAELVAELISGDAEVVIDTSGPALAALRGQTPTLVKVNEHEAAELLGVDATSADGVALSDGVGAAFGGASAIVTRGERGAVLSGSGGALEVSLDAHGSFPVGSGDAFLAGLLSARERGAGLDEQLRTAVAAGAANAAILGAGRLDPEAVAGLRDRAEVSALGTPGR
ncbi:MAG: PfkB family carbohydrate kinase [Solirubrobacterales bacterium]